MGRPVVHFELGCRDNAKTTAFYTKLFDWTAEPYGPTASMLSTGSDRGIQGHVTALGHEPHNYVMIYVEVDNIESYMETAKSLGATAKVGPIEIPGMGQFAWMADPEGTLFGLWKSVAK